MLVWSQDKNLANAIIKHDFVWDFVSEDGTDKESFDFPEIDGVEIRMCVCYAGKVCGAFFLFEIDKKKAHIHTCMLEKGIAKEFGDQVLKKIFKDTDYEFIETYVPKFNKAARLIAKWCGFKKVGYAKPFLKNGIDYPVEVWEYNKCL